MCRSVPQMDATFTLTSTSVRPKAGIFTSRTSAPGAACGLTTACIVPAMNATYQDQLKNDSNTKHIILAPCARPAGTTLIRGGTFSLQPGSRFQRTLLARESLQTSLKTSASKLHAETSRREVRVCVFSVSCRLADLGLPLFGCVGTG